VAKKKKGKKPANEDENQNNVNSTDTTNANNTPIETINNIIENVENEMIAQVQSDIEETTLTEEKQSQIEQEKTNTPQEEQQLGEPPITDEMPVEPEVPQEQQEEMPITDEMPVEPEVENTPEETIIKIPVEPDVSQEEISPLQLENEEHALNINILGNEIEPTEEIKPQAIPKSMRRREQQLTDEMPEEIKKKEEKEEPADEEALEAFKKEYSQIQAQVSNEIHKQMHGQELEYAVKHLKYEYEAKDGTKLTVDPDKDKEFAVICNNCLSTYSNLTLRAARRLCASLVQWGCACKSIDIQVVLTYDIELDKVDFGIEIKEYPIEVKRFYYLKFIQNPMKKARIV
jgi:hypothetical protein